MKQRKLKRRTVAMMDTYTWGFLHGVDIRDPNADAKMAANDKLYYSRKMKPCRTYSAWCPDCNTVEFKRTFGRFPHSVLEFNQFEDFQQATQGG